MGEAGMTSSVNAKIAEAFGLTGKSVREFTLHAAYGVAPTITITRHILSPDDLPPVKVLRECFELVLRETAPEEKLGWREWLDQEAARLKEVIAEDFDHASDILIDRFASHLHLARERSAEWEYFMRHEALRPDWLKKQYEEPCPSWLKKV
jgi:hypothetical protein